MNKQGIGNLLAICLLFFMICVAESQIDYSWLKPRKGIRNPNMTCQSGRVLFPYGPECADYELSKDLTRSPVLNLGFNLSFMGHQFDKVHSTFKTTIIIEVIKINNYNSFLCVRRISTNMVSSVSRSLSMGQLCLRMIGLSPIIRTWTIPSL